MSVYTMKDLVEMYGMTRAGVGKSLKEHSEAINANGTNVWQEGTKNEWRLTEEGRKIWDELRKTSTTIVERSAEAERITELLEENSTLKTQMLAIQAEVAVAYKKVAEMSENEKSNILLLSAAESDLKIAEADKHRQQKQIEAQAEEIARLKADLETERKAREKAQSAEARLNEELSKGFWGKVKDFFR